MPDNPTAPPESRCLQCGTPIDDPAESVTTKEGIFCAPCFAALRRQLEQAMRAQSTDINYPVAALGGLLGGAAGALLWWGFTIVTKISFGLVALVIGLGVGHGVLRFSGRRSRGLQVLSVVIAALAFFYGQFLVNRTLLLQYMGDSMPEHVVSFAIPLFPDPGLFLDVVTAEFGVFDFIFLAIVVFEAWRVPAPVSLIPRDRG